MIRERILTISTLMALMALSSVAYAGPRITDKSDWPNELAPRASPKSGRPNLLGIAPAPCKRGRRPLKSCGRGQAARPDAATCIQADQADQNAVSPSHADPDAFWHGVDPNGVEIAATPCDQAFD